ncbi:MAG: bifunctional DNA-formamidopyrimidine glycosylase/DNA-(apurinic or apyrimidinic site) lyase [Candidatus Pacebacteria bacterium]|nr:bifunctional DNA-formamidopyrimidine glycosylase/DNA-(apurinic or apyrimidinic site) lyase [Candidatus Paceibacterota bacterium]
MPELPEVQTITNDLNSKILNKKISSVDIQLKNIVKGNLQDFTKTLIDNSFKKIERRGKFIILKLERDNKHLIIHLRLTGQLIYQNKNEIIAGGHDTGENNFNLLNKQAHLIIHFEDNSKLFYNDQRQFGFLQIVNNKELLKIKEKLGVEPLDEKFTLEVFSKLLKGKKSNVKAFLLDQKHIAGIGNIYADETLFKAGIRPTRNLNSLDPVEIKKLFNSIKTILKKAVKLRGTSFNNYRDTDGNKGDFAKMLKVYGRDGEKCSVCNSIIIKTKVAGRGTRYCPKCQPNILKKSLNRPVQNKLI